MRNFMIDIALLVGVMNLHLFLCVWGGVRERRWVCDCVRVSMLMRVRACVWVCVSVCIPVNSKARSVRLFSVG